MTTLPLSINQNSQNTIIGWKSSLVSKGKMLNRSIYDLTLEFQKTDSCCCTCYSQIIEKFIEHKKKTQEFIDEIEFKRKLLKRFDKDFSEDEILSIRTPLDVCVKQSIQLEEQLTQKIQTIRKICFRESATRRLKGFLPSLVDVIWTTNHTLLHILGCIRVNIQSAIFTKKSNSFRDYLAPLTLLGVAFYQNDLILYGFLFLCARYLLRRIATIMVKKSGLGDTLSPRDFKLIRFLFQKHIPGQIYNLPGLVEMIKRREKKRSYQVHPFHDCITTPILEEILYRGIVQNGITFLSRCPLLGLTLSSILFGDAHDLGHILSSILFGDAHHNEWVNNYLHVINCSLGGLALGLLNNHYGILYSIYFHGLWNLAATLCYELKNK